jgi:hypothetical protein
MSPTSYQTAPPRKTNIAQQVRAGQRFPERQNVEENVEELFKPHRGVVFWMVPPPVADTVETSGPQLSTGAA